MSQGHREKPPIYTKDKNIQNLSSRRFCFSSIKIKGSKKIKMLRSSERDLKKETVENEPNSDTNRI